MIRLPTDLVPPASGGKSANGRVTSGGARNGRQRPINLNNPVASDRAPGRPIPEIRRPNVDIISHPSDNLAAGRVHDAGTNVLNPPQTTVQPPAPTPAPPSPSIQDKLNDMAKKVIQDNKSPNTIKPLSLFGISIASLPKALLSALPLLIYNYYNSVEKHLFNTYVKVSLADESPKQLTLALGMKGKTTLIKTIKIQPGKPAEFVQPTSGFWGVSQQPDSYFNPTSFLSSPENVPYFPVLEKIINWHSYRRQEFRTQVNVIIDDPGAEDLRNGPKLQTYNFSKFESVNVIRLDPRFHSNKLQGDLAGGSFIDFRDSSWTTSWKKIIKLAKPFTNAIEHRRQTTLLPFEDGFGKDLGMHLTVTQN